MTDGHRDNSVGERKLIWDEENRLLAVDDNGFVSNYWYDADGERTVKTSGESDQVYVNGVFSGGSTNTAKFSLYVSPYLVVNQGGRYTKHIYAGSQRIVSKVGDFASYGSDPRRIEYAGANTDGLSVDYKSKYAAQQQVIKDNYKFFDVPYNGIDNDNYADGEGFCCNDGSMEAAVAQARKDQTRAVSRSFKDPDNYENLQFFYHPDHLGSSSFITNLEGEVVQHIEYVPFGEVFIEERNDVWNTPYLFNAKEFDEETGMYYYGARYYEPRLSLWMSTDPKQEIFPYLSTYAFCKNNPIIVVDPNGMEWDYIEGDGTRKIVCDLNFTIADGFTQEQISAYKNAINAQFNASISGASNGTITGEIRFHTGNQDLVQRLDLDYISDPKIGGMTNYMSSIVTLRDFNGEMKSPEDIGIDAVHEMLHTLRLAHPFEMTQAPDTELISIGNQSYVTTSNTASNIVDNIMNYPSTIVNGKKSSNQTALTSGQLDFMINEIMLQKQGYGFYPKWDKSLDSKQNESRINKYYHDYWEFPGTPVSRK